MRWVCECVRVRVCGCVALEAAGVAPRAVEAPLAAPPRAAHAPQVARTRRARRTTCSSRFSGFFSTMARSTCGCRTGPRPQTVVARLLILAAPHDPTTPASQEPIDARRCACVWTRRVRGAAFGCGLGCAFGCSGVGLWVWLCGVWLFWCQQLSLCLVVLFTLGAKVFFWSLGWGSPFRRK